MKERQVNEANPMSAAENAPSLAWVEQPLLEWYRQNARDLPWRKTRDPYAIWVSEIMLQQTRVETVIPYYERFLTVLPTVEALAAAEEGTLLKLWEGLGYYSRVRNMQKAAVTVVSDFDGRFPDSTKALQKLCGIGSYTAGAVASIAYGVAAPAVDGNVIRVLARLIADERNIFDPSVKKAFEKLIAPWVSKSAPGEYNQGLIELGALICQPSANAKCESCPLRTGCKAYQTGRVTSIPSPKPPKPRKIDRRTMLILFSDDRLVIEKRPERGLLAGLWQLPSLSGHLTEREVLRRLRERGLDVVRIHPLPEAKHIFTHLEWHMVGYKLILSDLTSLPDGWRLVSEAELRRNYALPTAFSAYLPHLRNEK